MLEIVHYLEFDTQRTLANENENYTINNATTNDK